MNEFIAIERIDTDAVKTKIEFTIRQLMSFGRVVEQCFKKTKAEEIVNTLLNHSCEIILTTLEKDGVHEHVEQHSAVGSRIAAGCDGARAQCSARERPRCRTDRPRRSGRPRRPRAAAA